MTTSISSHLDAFPHVAIVRGLVEAEARFVGDTLFANGWRNIEVPLNRPGALAALRALSSHLEGSGVLIGAGTVTRPGDFEDAHDAGARFFLSPHTDPSLLDFSRTNGLNYVPGCSTPSDVMKVISFGIDVIKLFPYTLLGPMFISAMRGVTPDSIRFMAVGGVTLDTVHEVMPPADYVGVGSDLFRQGMATDDIVNNAKNWRKVVTQ